MHAPAVADPFTQRLDVGPLSSGPLQGTTFAVKDLFDVAGTVTGCGNPAWAATHAPAADHAAVITQLLRQGARLIGKTRTDELAYSLDGSNAHEGAPLNPAAPGRLSGGSSSGSAAATAAGAVDFALGTDTAGSVRVPAAWCGLFGLRTTHGRIDKRGLTPLAPSFDVVGWFARSGDMLRRVGQALPDDGAVRGDGCELVRDGACDALADAPVTDALRAWLDGHGGRSGPVHEVRLGIDWAEVAETLRVLQAGEAWRTHGAWIGSARPTFGANVAERFAVARTISAAQVDAAGVARAAILARLDERLPPGRVLVLPAVPAPPLPRTAGNDALQEQRRRVLRLTALASLSGRPQLTIPLRTADGLPVGAGLLGWRGGDAQLLDLAVRLAHA